jgi:predicted RNase H-like nuclease
VSNEAANDLIFIGLDLAWSPRNSSGAATLLGDEGGAQLLATPALLGDDDSIVDYVLSTAGSRDAIVAVDAPLTVPNASGRRRAEAELAADFQRYEAGAHPANRRLLSYGGQIRGEEIVRRLRADGFQQRAEITAGQRDRRIVEVFPHPAMIALFGLQRTLKYKARSQRTRETQLLAWQVYRQHLLARGTADPPLFGHEALLAEDIATLSTPALKAYEDRVDALFCAYIALYGLRWGAARCRVYGTLEEGSIFTPV